LAERKPTLAAVLGGWLLFIALETMVQVVFKLAGGELDADAGLAPLLRHALTTPIVLLGFGLYFCGFLVWITLLKDLDLGRAFPMTAIVYIATFSAAILLFHERPNATRILGVLVIMGGVVLLASDENSPREGAIESGKEEVDG
jgi:drug/metabolite transporter (DMT)-like permease